MNHFLADVIRGLSAPQKFLMSKYFYDKKGDAIFEEIMQMPEYYLTDCEWEILSQQKDRISNSLSTYQRVWDVVEFGPGNAVKSGELLLQMQDDGLLNTYYPIDISENVIAALQKSLPKRIPGISVAGFAGDYLEMLPAIKKVSANPRVFLFLGANIGNFEVESMLQFLRKLQNLLGKDDMILIGFDLKKHPQTILQAYNDRSGITARFNLNLLERINRELQADFQLDKFQHYCCYDPLSGACSSYLVSLVDQRVEIGDVPILFEKNETIFMEVSQKYSVAEIEKYAVTSGFSPVDFYFDSRRWFVDVLLKKNMG